MLSEHLNIKVHVFQDQDGKTWKHVRVQEVVQNEAGAVRNSSFATVENGWLCEDGRLHVGSLYSGGETGAWITSFSRPTKDNPREYDNYKTWYEIVA